MENEKKVVVSYTVERYDNGDIDVKDNKVEGTTEMQPEAIYKDIEDVAAVIKMKRYENAAYVGARRFYMDLQRAQQEQEREPAQVHEAEPIGPDVQA